MGDRSVTKVDATACPLCGNGCSRASWLGSTVYHGREFPYSECLSCRSLFCDPMPDAKTLTDMYGPGYLNGPDAEAGIGDPKDRKRVVDWLQRANRGTFLDFGCGDGALLVEATRRGWRAIGVEYDEQVATAAAKRTGAMVVTDVNRYFRAPVVDLLNLGDVIEHLTDLDRRMAAILALVKPGGLVLAQGPLEANDNVYTLLLRLARKLRTTRTEMAPYHVILATSLGQRTLFSRLGLAEIEYSVSEVEWPAPNRLSTAVIKNPKALSLFAVRRFSQAVSRLHSDKWGNRYFYAGRKLHS
jgi:SAM-dependent methyltransferase